MTDSTLDESKSLKQLVAEWEKAHGKKFPSVIGMSEAHFRRVKSLECRPKDHMVERIAATLGMPVSELPIKGNQTGPPPDAAYRRITAYLALGGNGVYRTKDHLYDHMNHSAVSIIAAAGPQAPQRFIEGLANRMVKLVEIEQLVSFRAYLLFDPNRIVDLAEVKRRYEMRQRIFQEHGIEQYVEVFACEVQPPSNLDFCIVDRLHVAIAVKGLRSEGAPVLAVEFWNRPELAGAILDWFFTGVGQIAVPFSVWIERRMSKQPRKKHNYWRG